jgi:hypothetical protein
MTDTVVTHNGWQITTTTLPDKKRPQLLMRQCGKEWWFILATFNTKDAQEAFDAFLEGNMDGYMKGKEMVE